jgi:hypothetical protein
MPGTGRYGTVASNLRKKNVLLSKTFPSDPQQDGSFTHEKLIAIANEKLLPSVQAGDPVLMPRVVFDFSAGPSLVDVTTSAADPNKGLPMTPFSPNVVSPGADPAGVGDTVATNVDPTRSADPGLTPADVRPSVVIGTNGTVSPSVTGPEISSLKLNSARETLQFGKHNIT